MGPSGAGSLCSSDKFVLEGGAGEVGGGAEHGSTSVPASEQDKAVDTDWEEGAKLTQAPSRRRY